MPIYLLRHADAVSEAENKTRPLSELGQKQVGLLAAFLRNNNQFTPTQIWHSPLARARETAERLHAGLQSEAALVETAGLLPEDDPEEIANRLGKTGGIQCVAIVGHQPHLGALATLLLRGKPGPELLDFKKAAVSALECTNIIHRKTGRSRWRASWFVTPEILGTFAR